MAFMYKTLATYVILRSTVNFLGPYLAQPRLGSGAGSWTLDSLAPLGIRCRGSVQADTTLMPGAASSLKVDSNCFVQVPVSGIPSRLRCRRPSTSGSSTCMVYSECLIGLWAMLAVGISSLFGCMQSGDLPGELRGGGFNYRSPPAWGPEIDYQYSFLAYTTDLVLWSTLTDLAPHQQAAAIVLRLKAQLEKWLEL